jgi:hypothetical protein
MLNRVAQSALRGLRLYFCLCPANASVSPHSAKVGMAEFKYKSDDPKAAFAEAEKGA